MRGIVRLSAFKADLKRISRSGRYKLDDLLAVIGCPARDETLAERHRDHTLGGNWDDHRECYIKPDWSLINRLQPQTLVLVRTGSHATLF